MIDGQFSECVNNIDIKAENLLQLDGLTNDQIEKIEKKRCDYIREIEKVKQHNLNAISQLKSVNSDPQSLFSKFCFNVCFDYSNNHEVESKFRDFIDEYFGYLFICDRFLSKNCIEFIKNNSIFLKVIILSKFPR
jgi:hypothetical protein